MSSKEITAIALRVFAIYLLANMLIAIWPMAAVLASTGFSEQPEFPLSAFVVTLVAMLIVGGVIVWLLFRLSNSVLQKAPDAPAEIAARFNSAVLIQLLGLFFVVSVIGELPYWFTLQLKPGKIVDFQELYLSRYSFEFVCGLILIAMPQRILAVMMKLTRFDASKP